MSTTSPADLLIRGGTVVRPGITPFEADIVVRGNAIENVVEPNTAVEASEVVDATGLHVFPGVIDPHTHIGAGNGLAEYASETGAAALGGVTTLLSILADPGSYESVLTEHLDAASASARIDFGFNLTLMTPEHLEQLPALREQYGLRSYKYFMHFRGDEGAYFGVAGTHDGHMYNIMSKVGQLGDLLFVHAENPEVVWALRDQLKDEGREDLAAWDDARPPFVEAEAVRRVPYFANRLGTRVYLVHISTADSLAQIRAARAEFPSLELSVETCPHYLTHSVNYAGGIVGKVNPPLRREEHIEPLWQAIADGTVDTVGSDHVSRLLATKTGTIWTASAGFPGSPTLLPTLLSYGHRDRGLPLERIAQVTSGRAAELLGLAGRKGDIKAGYDADFALVDLNHARKPDPAWLGTNSDYSLYSDHELIGWARHTIVRGTAVVRDHEVVAAPGTGRYIQPINAKAAS